MTGPTASSATVRAVPERGTADRLRAAIAGVGAAVLGAAPHVLHHVGPLAGAALLAGATGQLLFGAAGFLLAVPMLRRLHRRRGSWAVPGGMLALMAVAFTISSVVIGPALTDGGRESRAPAQNVPSAPSGIGPSEHESHHR
jgi:hypothetical protein